MSVKKNNIEDIYKTLIENYNYDIMYEPIDINVDTIELDETSNNFQKIIVDHNYDAKYYKEPRKIIENTFSGNNTDYKEEDYKDIMMEYKYKDDANDDPLEDLRKAENYAETLETELLKLASEYEKLVIANSNLHKTLEKGGENKKIKELSSAIKRLEREIMAKNILNSSLQGQINLQRQINGDTTVTERPSPAIFNKNMKRRHMNDEDKPFYFAAPPTISSSTPPIVPPQSPYQFQ
jgi:hypothetical protein